MSASSIITNFLASYGLEFDKADVMRWAGLFADDNRNTIIIDEEIRASPQFTARFPGMKMRLDNDYEAMSVNEYRQTEDQLKSIFRNSGLPSGFYDTPEELAEFIGNDVAPTEVESRVFQGFEAARQAPDDVKDALNQFYGVPDAIGSLAAYYLDPERGLPAIQRQFETAQIAVRAERTGFGGIGQQNAEALQRLGITQDQATQGFSALASQRGLFTSNLGQDQTFSRDEQMAAQFESDADVLERIRRQRDKRKAGFAGVSNAAMNDEGLLALGRGIDAGS